LTNQDGRAGNALLPCAGSVKFKHRAGQSGTLLQLFATASTSPQVALLQTWVPLTRYTFQSNAESIMKVLFCFSSIS